MKSAPSRAPTNTPVSRVPCLPAQFMAVPRAICLRAASALLFLLAAIALAAMPAVAGSQEVEPKHGIAMLGEPALPADFTHLPYANPAAPQGGAIRYGVVGTFDSLNPFILNSMRTTARGMWDPEYGRLVFESLMTRSADEPFTLYGLLAESVAMPEDRSWMEFMINPAAKWSDGKPVIPEDVIFTYELLTEKGRPPFNARMRKIERIEKTADNKVKFTFNAESDREFPLIVAGFMPVLPKHATPVDGFENSTLTAPVGSGPYLIKSIEPGSRIAYQRRGDYWGKDLPVNRGQLNFDEIIVDYFGSAQSRFEAFKKGLFDVYAEGDPAEWERAYDFPAVAEGKVKKAIFEARTPANMYAFFFNTRRPAFTDIRVRQALAMLFDFEWTNRNLFFDAYTRTASFWQGSDLSALGNPASDAEKALLAPYPNAVSQEVMDGTWRPPVTDGSGRDRKVLRAALELLKQAGYATSDGKLVDPDGKPFAFEIMTKGESEERLAIAYKRSLEILGIEVGIRAADDAQYQRRLQDFDYDMILQSYSASLSPGAEQEGRWASASRDTPGSFNYAGASDPAIDALVDVLLKARDPESFTAAVRALDRVLMSGHYVVPLFHLKSQRVAHWDRVAYPETTPLFGVHYPVWWSKEAAN
jgi:peptide/nickel transport system substrate-binding protein